ncbi:hypothetical protein [Endozoicomonas ascidiicola]|uniref:hypothetical protein n=1 Tax=Endozoicomonas ascidiicola TaxID=1698521 RepID=UPI000830F859|nr:hypothetical protein [Endozoicomonas ascidiicola]
MKRVVFSATALLLAVAIGLFFYLQPEETESLLANDGKGLFDLEAHWAQGNVVSLIRHTERCDRSENQCHDGADGITVPGVDQAIEVGKAYGNLPEHATIIYNSPVKRTEQSADFMFGERSEDKSWLREGCKQNLLNDIFEHKQPGKNLILVTHSTCIDALGEVEDDKVIEFDIHEEETYGGSFFLTVDKGERKVHVLGYLLAEEWDDAY